MHQKSNLFALHRELYMKNNRIYTADAGGMFPNTFKISDTQYLHI